MRRFDKINNIIKVNLLAEQRYLQSKGLISENGFGGDEINEEFDYLANVTSKISEVVRENDGPNAKSLTLKFNDGSEMYMFQNMRLGKKFHIPSEYDEHRYEAYSLYRLLANNVFNYWDVYKHFDNIAVDVESDEFLNEFEFDIPRKPVTNGDMGKFEERDRMKHRLEAKFNGLSLINSEDHNRRNELGDGNLVIQTKGGNLQPEIENEIAKLADRNGWGFEAFLDGLYLIYQGDYYGNKYQGNIN
jgi:hypothetical protein